jgi:hypothetical protein
MCFSYKSSIISYLIGMCAGIFALLTRQIVLGCFILIYSQIQLSEAIIWYGIDNNNKNINKIGTLLNKYLLITHIIGIGFGIILSKKLISKSKINNIDYIPLIIGIFFFIISFIYYKKNKPVSYLTYPKKYNDINCRNCQNSNNRLDWKFKHTLIYLISFIISILIALKYLKPYESLIILLIFYSWTFIPCYLLYRNELSTMWCFIASYLSPMIVLLNYNLIKNLKNTEILI